MLPAEFCVDLFTGRPEITVNINDDWTVSPDESRDALQDDRSEDSVQSNDEVNVDDNHLVTSFYNNVRTFPPRRKFSSDDEVSREVCTLG